MTHQPRVGQAVWYYNPKIVGRVGRTTGYGGRAAGPYAAIVTNDIGAGVTVTVFFPSMSPMEFTAVPFEDDVVPGQPAEKGYWGWQDNLAKARFLKARAEHADAAARAKAAEVDA